jgi:hypothetical protein
MKKYGYKNIADMNEFSEAAKAEGKHEFSYKSENHLNNQGFINWGNQNNWGTPGQTVYKMKDLDQLIKANEIVSK